MMKSMPGGPCGHCGRTSTPCWRKGPPEKPVLCNACGSRYLVKRSLDGYMPGQKPAAIPKPKKKTMKVQKKPYNPFGDYARFKMSRPDLTSMAAKLMPHFDGQASGDFAAALKAAWAQQVANGDAYGSSGLIPAGHYKMPTVAGMGAEEFNNFAASTLALLGASSDDERSEGAAPSYGRGYEAPRNRRKQSRPACCAYY